MPNNPRIRRFPESVKFRLLEHFRFSLFLSVSIRSTLQFDIDDYNTVGGGKSSNPLKYDKSLRINGGEAAIVG